MTAPIPTGTKVIIAPGTSVMIWDGISYFDADSVLAGQRKFSRYTWDDSDNHEIVCSEGGLTVESYMGPHATMNGGGYDFTLSCGSDRNNVRVRSTFQNPHERIFTLVTAEVEDGYAS